ALGDRLVDLGFGAGWAVASRTPPAVTAGLFDAIGRRLWAGHGAGVRQLEANLSRAVPTASEDELRELSRAAMASYFRYWHEVFRLPSEPRQRIVNAVVTVGEAPLREAMAQQRGAVVALPHMGNWDHAGAWASLTGMPVTAVAERLRPQSLFDRFVGYREQLGIEVVGLAKPDASVPGAPVPRSDRSTVLTLREALRRGRLVCLVADRDLSRNGVPVTLLGEAARLPAGPAALARLADAALFAVTLSYSGPLLRLTISYPVPPRPGSAGLRAMTQDVADHFSAGIRQTPADWHMLQPVFAADLASQPAAPAAA
ncbi:MAG: phosphatidylinositol dimannoside acyltransferase, partial [Pseudonocardiales bacterium]|nr:phosphatidylinositol dimannoside acyltransferase [Pseudonocardiales bacterium]